MLRTLAPRMRCAFVLLSLLATSSAFAASQKEWTFLVFMNGNNNLDAYGAMDINEMETIGSTDQVNVVVQWASLENGSTKRVFVQKDNDPNRVSSPIIEDIGNADMGDWRQLVEFVRWGVQHYPARHYFINVWNHGSGWHLKNAVRGLDGQLHITDISWDDKSHNHITTEQLGQAMTESAKIIGHKVDVYGSDACLMGMAEVAGEMSDTVETFVGAQEVEPLKGWPYDSLLSRWNAVRSATGADVGKILVEEYIRSYQGGSQGNDQVTLSAFDMNKYGGLTTAVRDFGARVKKLDRPARDKIVRSAEATQKFTYSDYGDLIDFVDQVEAAGVPGFERSETRALRQAASAFVIANGATTNYQRAHGVSIWLPSSSYSYESYIQRYRGLHFHAATGWGEAVEALYRSN